MPVHASAQAARAQAVPTLWEAVRRYDSTAGGGGMKVFFKVVAVVFGTAIFAPLVFLMTWFGNAEGQKPVLLLAFSDSRPGPRAAAV